MSDCKARPILFSGPMVRALLEGRKTQTRRIVKPQPKQYEHDGQYGLTWGKKSGGGCEWLAKYSPHGQPGDLLYVREAFNDDWSGISTIYRADGGSAIEAGYPSEPKWKPSIHMRRYQSRLTLRITDVRVERVQDISEADIYAEGLQDGSQESSWQRVQWRELWQSINGDESWNENPWVCALTFEVIKQNVDDVIKAAA